MILEMKGIIASLVLTVGETINTRTSTSQLDEVHLAFTRFGCK